MKEYWFFENINLFDLLCPHKYKAYCNDHSFLKYQKNEFIYLEGDLAKNFFLVSNGVVKIGFVNESGDEIITSYLKKGEIFGESVIVNQNSRNEFAQAASNNTELCSVNINQVEELMRDNSNFSIGILKFIGFRLKKIERKYQIMLFRNTRTRIIEFIKEMIEEANSKKLLNGEVLISNPYSQSEMAKLVGTSRPNFNVLLNELQEEGYLNIKKGEILLRNKFLLEF